MTLILVASAFRRKDATGGRRPPDGGRHKNDWSKALL